jgi:hypothetical protein
MVLAVVLLTMAAVKKMKMTRMVLVSIIYLPMKAEY